MGGFYYDFCEFSFLYIQHMGSFIFILPQNIPPSIARLMFYMTQTFKGSLYKILPQFTPN